MFHHNADLVLLSADLVLMTLELVLMNDDQVLLTVDLALLTEDQAHLPKNPNPLCVREIRTTSVTFTKKFLKVLLDDPPHLKLVINRALNPHLFLKIKAKFKAQV
jgi:hypothetical protein